MGTLVPQALFWTGDEMVLSDGYIVTKPGYFGREKAEVTHGASLSSLPVPVGECANWWNPNLEYNGLGAGNCISTLKTTDRSHSYYGRREPRERTTGEYPEHTYIATRHTSSPKPVVGIYKGTGGSYSLYGADCKTWHKPPDLQFVSVGGGGGSGSRYTQPRLGILDDLGTYVKPLLIRYEREALDKAMDKLRITDVGETLVELSEVVFMLKGILKNQDATLTAVRRIDWSRLYDRSYLVSVLDILAGTWLSWNLAIKPNLQMIADLVLRFDEISETMKYVAPTAYIRDKELVRVNKSLYFDLANGTQGEISAIPGHPWCYTSPPNSYSGGYTERIVDGNNYDISAGFIVGAPKHLSHTRVSCDIRIAPKVVTSSEFVLHQLGLDNPLLLGYQVLPFSFVLDWFVKVGHALEGLSLRPGQKFLDIGETIKYTYQTETSSGSTFKSEVITRFTRGPGIIHPYTVVTPATAKYGVMSGNPWSSTDELMDLEPLSLEIGDGVKGTWRAITSASLIYTLAKGLPIIETAAKAVLTSKQYWKYKHLWS